LLSLSAQGCKKPGVFLKNPTRAGFIGFFGVLLGFFRFIVFFCLLKKEKTKGGGISMFKKELRMLIFIFVLINLICN
jgi:hypothetical protein